MVDVSDLQPEWAFHSRPWGDTPSYDVKGFQPFKPELSTLDWHFNV